MRWYPLWNSLRIAAISSVLVFFLGILCPYYVARLPRVIKGLLDVVLTLPVVLPPTVCGYFLLLFGTKRPLGIFLARFGIRFVMTWYGGILDALVATFPLMYRTARSPFESFDKILAYSGQTLGLSCAGLCPGAGRIRRRQQAHRLHPDRTATISTTVHQFWRTNDEAEAMF